MFIMRELTKMKFPEIVDLCSLGDPELVEEIYNLSPKLYIGSVGSPDGGYYIYDTNCIEDEDCELTEEVINIVKTKLLPLGIGKFYFSERPIDEGYSDLFIVDISL